MPLQFLYTPRVQHLQSLMVQKLYMFAALEAAEAAEVAATQSPTAVEVQEAEEVFLKLIFLHNP